MASARPTDRHATAQPADHSWAITEEKTRNGDSDTSRFLAAGAERVWWVRTEQGRLAEAMPRIREKLNNAQSVIVESNSILKFLRPDLYVTVLDPSTADFKSSAREFLDRADAAILHEAKNGDPAWKDVSLKPVSGKPIFRITPPPYVTSDIVNFIREKMARRWKARAFNRKGRKEHPLSSQRNVRDFKYPSLRPSRPFSATLAV